MVELCVFRPSSGEKGNCVLSRHLVIMDWQRNWRESLLHAALAFFILRTCTKMWSCHFRFETHLRETSSLEQLPSQARTSFHSVWSRRSPGGRRRCRRGETWQTLGVTASREGGEGRNEGDFIRRKRNFFDLEYFLSYHVVCVSRERPRFVWAISAGDGRLYSSAVLFAGGQGSILPNESLPSKKRET